VQKKGIYLLVMILGGISLWGTAAQMQNSQTLEANARQIVKQFASRLKPKLVGAIKQGGLAHAIRVCSEEAPLIARKLSQQTGWSVKRVSLQPRNKATATPDRYEHIVLRTFDKLAKETPMDKPLERSMLNGNTFRYMKAQRVEAICLNCHGQNISSEVAEALKKHYPEDVATGYALGEVRGAFSLSFKIKEQ